MTCFDMNASKCCFSRVRHVCHQKGVLDLTGSRESEPVYRLGFGARHADPPPHAVREGRRRGLKEFTAALIRRDLKLASADQSCDVLHVVKPLIKNTQADEHHMLGVGGGDKTQTSIFS